MCCYDGVYLQDDEESCLVELVQRVPELAAKLPDEFIVDGYWEGEYYGRKTATRPHDYRSAAFPAHFARTRCVFADAEGFCELEKLGRAQGRHPWTFKPATCWQFPLHFDNEIPVAPPKSVRDDPYRTKSYPGYSTFVSCGKHDPGGQPWRAALSGELAYWERTRRPL